MPHLLIFARHPELGRVKTRLAADIGAEGALAVYQELLAHTRAVVAPLAVHKTVWLAEAPAAPLPAPEWPGYEPLLQPAGDLGQKMQTAFAHAFARQAGRVLIIGTDCPGLTTALLTEAFEALLTHDVVLGPAADGGYYLLGMRQLYPQLFQAKSWSTATVRAETLADIRRLQLRLHQLPELQDIDTGADLKAWQTSSGRTLVPGLRVV
ncbi:TIGR04282 family arsenosugar biosynthesis glycosyltransferase [Hymenobacter metallilatus]|uniref:Glycosyltransferase n=1 Tax=Hymenobacter metallilatus TaxID=2493666 RepID=A0A3R9M259_9BACT|nr:TIGR04282 family arsenosugar biosynthesis glycosyltransferase [Hymenobacter metallilatus]RSK34557.1 glycosyltransferase [Hymenobacter metallilatus]